MKRCFKTFIIFVSVSMIIFFYISMSAGATEQDGITGNGHVEGIVQPYVYQVVLPTCVDGCFDFIMDPQRLIEETDGAAYGGLSFEKDATVFFRRTDGQTEEDYSSSSDLMNIVNRSNVSLNVIVSVKISEESLGGITMTEDRTFAEDTGASLYLALTDGARTVPVRDGVAYIQTTLPAAPEEAFEYVYDQERGEYSYGLKKELGEILFPKYSFQLTGAVNESEDWASVRKANPSVIVTWGVIPDKSISSTEKSELSQDILLEQNEDISQDMRPEEKENRDEEDIVSKSEENTDPAERTTRDEGTEQEAELSTDRSMVPEEENVDENRVVPE